MNQILTDIMAVIGVVLNGLPQGLLALTFGFASIPTAMAFFVGAVGNTVTQSVAPISFQAETITYAGTAGKNRSECCTMVFFGAVIMTIIGCCGMLTKIVDFIGADIANGMMAGVGIMLAATAIDMVKKEKVAGGVSLAVALVTYVLTSQSSNTLVYTILASVVASCVVTMIYGKVSKKEQEAIVVVDDKFKRQKFTINSRVIMGALGMVCLNIGSNISFGAITASMAPNANFNVDNLTVISSLADMASSFFGGAPVESIISATAAAPHAVWCGVAMMLVIGVLLLAGILPKISKFVPPASIAGFLFVLGVFKTVALDAPAALANAPAVGGITMVATAITNPFIGMIAGLLAKFIGL